MRNDLESYSILGGIVSREVLSKLKTAASEIRVEFDAVQTEAVKKLRSKVGAALANAEVQFLQAHVADRSAHSLFADAIRYALSRGAASTSELHIQVKALLPDLCDDSRDLVINGQHFGKKWKHTVRTAQVFLRRKGEIKLIDRKWHLNV